MFKKLVLTLALASISATAAASAVIYSEDFESYTTGLAPSGSTFATYTGTLGTWSVLGASVDTIKGGFGAITNISLDLDGTPGPGGITRTIATVAGHVYQLNFDYSGNGGAQPFSINFGGVNTNFTGSSGVTAFASGFFTATGATTTLSFQGTSGGNSGATIDNITVTDVPEPGVLGLLLGGLVAGGLVKRRAKK